MNSINGQVEWKNDYTYYPTFLNQRKVKYDKIIKYFDDSEPCQSVENLKVLQRIGSQSKSAEVFLLKIDNIKESVALKVLPIIDSNSYIKNENEIRIAVSASNLVLEGSSIYFPLVYEFDNCENTIFYSDNFNIKSSIYQRRSGSYKSHILLSELAKEDLYTYLYKNMGIEGSKISEENFLKLIKRCLKAINDLHNKLNVLHNDLHLRNFLIIEYENDIIPLIHDFGSSEICTEFNLRLYELDKLDIEFFIERLLELEFISNDLKDKIKELVL